MKVLLDTNQQILEIRKDVAEILRRQQIHEDVLIGHNLRFDDVESRFDSLEARMSKLEERMDKLEKRMDKLEERMDRIEQKLDQVISLLMSEREERMAMMAILVSHDKRLTALENKLL